MRQTVRYLGLVLVVVGVVVGFSPTFGFATLTADRGLSVATADDGSALIALESTGATIDGTDGTVVATLRNNIDGPITTTFSPSVDAGALAVETSGGTETIASGDGRALSVSCGSASGESGTAQLQVTVPMATGQDVSIQNAILAIDIAYDCPNSGPPGDGTAFDDRDGDGLYDPGETAYTAAELENFDNESVDLVVSDAGAIEFQTSGASITAKKITIKETTLDANQDLTLEATSGSVTLDGATLESRTGKVSVEGDSISSQSSTITSNKAVTLAAGSGSVDISGSLLDSNTDKITVEGDSIVAEDASFMANREISLEASSTAVRVSRSTFDSGTEKITLTGGPVVADGATFRSNTDITIESTSGTTDLRGATLDSDTGQITVTGPSILADGATFRADNGFSLIADSAAVDISDASLIATYGDIVVTAGTTIDATGSSFENNPGVTLTAGDAVTLTNADIQINTGWGSAAVDLDAASATLAVGGLSVDDNDDTLVYSPSGVTVTGTPSSGSVASN